MSFFFFSNLDESVPNPSVRVGATCPEAPVVSSNFLS